MIPHPLTLLFCWVVGNGLASAVGYVLEFAGQLCADAVRYGWAGPGFFSAALLVIGVLSSFTGGLFTGAATRLLAEKSWLKAAGWAVLLCGLAAALTSPRLLPAAALGCFLGAFLMERFRDAREVEAVEGFLRNWMFWERGGAA